MTLKKTLGLEDCPLSEMEIYRQIEGCRRNNQQEALFTTRHGKKVRVKVASINPLGIMRGYEEYYAR